jgi:hypothetical protein
MSGPLRPDDPCYFMLERGRADPSQRSTTTVYDDDCYICRDEEFALMGLPLCYPCPKCKGHVPADDSVCSDCGHDCRPNDDVVEVAAEPAVQS